MSIATTSNQAAPAPIQSTTVSSANQVTGSNQIQPGQPTEVKELNKLLAAAQFRISELERVPQNQQVPQGQSDYNQFPPFPNQDFRQNFRSNYRGRYNQFRGNWNYGRDFSGNQPNVPNNQLKTEGAFQNQQPFYNRYNNFNNLNPPVPSPTRPEDKFVAGSAAYRAERIKQIRLFERESGVPLTDE